MLSRPEMQPILKLWSENRNLQKDFLLAPEEIDQLLVFWEGTPVEPAQPGREPFIPPPSGFVIRFKRPQDAKAFLLRHRARAEGSPARRQDLLPAERAQGKARTDQCLPAR